jgi:hypothetical protein
VSFHPSIFLIVYLWAVLFFWITASDYLLGILKLSWVDQFSFFPLNAVVPLDIPVSSNITDRHEKTEISTNQSRHHQNINCPCKHIPDIWLLGVNTNVDIVKGLWKQDNLRVPKHDIQWQPEPLSRNESGRFGALKSDSTHNFFRNACTKSGSLRFSQFSGCWLILSVYILMSFDFPFGRLFGVR